MTRISIVIPALNEASGIGQAVSRARALQPHEIIVVDGESTDGTAQHASSADQVISSPRGRATQQNRGAREATGDVLLFLHVDCWLEPGSLALVARSCENSAVIGGCFRQIIDAAGWRFRWLEWGNTQRVRWWTLAYGDQGIFVRKNVFDRLGGFPELRLMEDLFFMRRLREEGRFDLLGPLLHVSARRWIQHGVVRQTLRNWALTFAAACGVSPNTLARFYPHVR